MCTPSAIFLTQKKKYSFHLFFSISKTRPTQEAVAIVLHLCDWYFSVDASLFQCSVLFGAFLFRCSVLHRKNIACVLFFVSYVSCLLVCYSILFYFSYLLSFIIIIISCSAGGSFSHSDFVAIIMTWLWLYDLNRVKYVWFNLLVIRWAIWLKILICSWCFYIYVHEKNIFMLFLIIDHESYNSRYNLIHDSEKNFWFTIQKIQGIVTWLNLRRPPSTHDSLQSCNYEDNKVIAHKLWI